MTSKCALYAWLTVALLVVATVAVRAANAQPSPGALDDVRINAAVEAAIAQEPMLAKRRVSVQTRAATVYLSGMVYTMEEFAIAAAAAWAVHGVLAVRNALRIEHPASRA